MVLKHFQDKASAAAKAEKEEEQRLRKIASFVAKEIRTFWANVEKVLFFFENEVSLAATNLLKYIITSWWSTSSRSA